MKDVVERIFERNQKKKMFFETLLYSTDYIDWLGDFTHHVSSFTSDCEDESISLEDQRKIENLEFFFEAIQEYASENYIYPHLIDNGEYYAIQYHGVGYHVGIDYGQGSYFYCTRVSKVEEDALEFKHLMSSVKLPQTLLFECKLEELQNMICRMHEEDSVPLEAIRFSVEDTIQKIKNKKKNS